MVDPSDIGPEQGYLSLDRAAARLGLPVDRMLAMNMVIRLPDGRGRERVPDWCADPAIARVMPLLSDDFSGEALEFCLLNMRPLGDGQSGVDLLRAGDWRIVRDTLRLYRRRFDQIMQSCATQDWLARYANGAGQSAPFPA